MAYASLSSGARTGRAGIAESEGAVLLWAKLERVNVCLSCCVRGRAIHYALRPSLIYDVCDSMAQEHLENSSGRGFVKATTG